MINKKPSKAFTMIELLVVISIIALLISILLPALSLVREKASVARVNAELRQIGICIEMYTEDNGGKHPPTREDCSVRWHDHQLPPELVEGGYLSPPEEKSGMSAGIEDPYNKGNTYKYRAVGELYQNGRYMEDLKKSYLYVPKGFPAENPRSRPESDIKYTNPNVSPVTWVLYSQGPEFDQWQMIKEKNGPVPRRVWYDSKERKGVIVRMKLRGKPYDHIGTFKD
ncbi:type II secretion system protein [Sedimentisphaera salicampi]|uniref:Type II secretion system protein G n=1 Tax=Sedimentisphaera salicampi TaxID=1941349 RepID=A0A1W6LL71_9BACT|nr:prepilin-type N-terminal cleavage/methylation domain-containing protein [Sedimentisphaera salicampi]ARN56505.1 type II secretion system protein G [Sedimentisphaera salicampi]OXU15388.1 type II secretion system protein G [Sedimentisphaera salicampi]